MNQSIKSMSADRSYTVTIPGEPVAKARARVTKAGHAYTPKRTVDYERMVQTLFHAEHGSPALEGPILLRLDLYFGIPKSRNKGTRERMRQGLERPCKRPDIDNCMKSVSDALNGVAYKDDSQIVAAVIQKFWADEPRAVVTIEELDLEEDVIPWEIRRGKTINGQFVKEEVLESELDDEYEIGV